MAQPFKGLARMLSPNTSLNLSPVARSRLAQQLLAQSQSGQMGVVSGYGTAAKLVNALKQRQAGNQERQEAEQTAARQQGLAGALSRTNSGNPAQSEAARRAALIIAGGLPNDPTAQGLLQGQVKAQFSGPDNLFGVVDPSGFTPESLQKFSQTRQYGDLIPRENIYGRYTPSQYTAESWAKFKNSNDPVDLVLRPEFRFSSTPSGAVVAGNTLSGQVSPTTVTPEVAIDEAARRQRAEAEAAAQGQATGKAQGALLTRAFNADNITDILDIAEPLIDEATGSGTGAARDKLAAFFGESTTGAKAIAQLLPLQAAIMLNQPRMEGPQSDRDVQLYREAAGQLGDPNIPRETKKAAIITIRRLQNQYRQRANPQSATGEMPDVSSMSDDELRRLAGGQ